MKSIFSSKSIYERLEALSPKFGFFGISAGAAVGLAGAAISAGASIASSSSGARASESNSQRNARLLKEAQDTARGDIYGSAGQAQGYQNPYVDAGGAALKSLSEQLGMGHLPQKPNPGAEKYKLPNGQINQAALQQDQARWKADMKQGGMVSPLNAPPTKAQFADKKGKVDTTAYTAAAGAWKNKAAQWAKKWGVDTNIGDLKSGAAQNWYDSQAKPKISASDTAMQNFQQGQADNAKKNTPTGMVQDWGKNYRNSSDYYAPVVDSASFEKDAGGMKMVADEASWAASGDPGYIAPPKDMHSLDDLKSNDPGYEFRLQQGANSINQSAAMRGLLQGNGGAAKELQSFGSDYASQEYGNAYQRYMQQLQYRQKAFQDRVGLGQNAFQNAFSRGLQAADQSWKRLQGAAATTQQNNQFMVGVGQNAANQSSEIASAAGAQSAGVVQGSANAAAANNNMATASQISAGQNIAGAVGNLAANATYAYNRFGRNPDTPAGVSDTPMITNAR